MSPNSFVVCGYEEVLVFSVPHHLPYETKSILSVENQISRFLRDIFFAEWNRIGFQRSVVLHFSDLKCLWHSALLIAWMNYVFHVRAIVSVVSTSFCRWWCRSWIVCCHTLLFSPISTCQVLIESFSSVPLVLHVTCCGILLQTVPFQYKFYVNTTISLHNRFVFQPDTCPSSHIGLSSHSSWCQFILSTTFLL